MFYVGKHTTTDDPHQARLTQLECSRKLLMNQRKESLMDHHPPPRAPLWKWLLILTLILALPLFFSFYREAQIQQALNQTNIANPSEFNTQLTSGNT